MATSTTTPTATTWFGNRARAMIGLAGSKKMYDVQVGRGCEITVEWENVELYGTDSILRQDVSRHTLKVTANLKGCKFDPGVAETKEADNKFHPTTTWQVLLHALNPTAGGGTVEDSNVVQLFNVTIYMTGNTSPADNLLKFEITDAYIENFPFPMPENDYITLDLNFVGTTIKITNNGKKVDVMTAGQS